MCDKNMWLSKRDQDYRTATSILTSLLGILQYLPLQDTTGCTVLQLCFKMVVNSKILFNIKLTHRIGLLDVLWLLVLLQEQLQEDNY